MGKAVVYHVGHPGARLVNARGLRGDRRDVATVVWVWLAPAGWSGGNGSYWSSGVDPQRLSYAK